MGRKSDGAGARVVDVAAAPSMGRNAVGGGAPTDVVSSGGPLSSGFSDGREGFLSYLLYRFAV